MERRLEEVERELEQQRRAAQGTRRDLERQRQIAHGLREILVVLNSAITLDDVLDHVSALAQRFVGAAAVEVYHLVAPEGPLRVQVARGAGADLLARIDIPLGHGVVGRAVTLRRPFAVSNVPVYYQAEFCALRDAGDRALMEEALQHYRAAIGVPVIVRDEVCGGLVLDFGDPREFSDEDIEFASALGDQVALAIENTRLREQAREAGAAAERNRLARDLHDAVTQTLFSASLIAEVLPRLWERDSEEGRRRLEELRQLTRGALAEMRTLLLELRPAALTDAKLEDLLRSLAEAATGRAKVPTSVIVRGHGALAVDVKIAFYRVAQEALNNVTKHAAARQAWVHLSYDPGTVELRVADDGRGFDPGRPAAERLGLGIMRERAESVGAAFEIESGPGRGSQVVVTWKDLRRQVER